ncbi:DUF5408 family protein [Thermotoga caldifontis]|uniref:DUF5408 family protein n=1 Tax=Thermotoga caldifontis TaxID=1508419 RepID=UPI000596D6E4|nr:DUF5408 family protein [Thermotoga caldifontis]
MTPVKSIAKRRSHSVERVLSLFLVRIALVMVFLAVLVVSIFPLVRLMQSTANLSRENKVLQTRIVELEQQIRQLKLEQTLLMSSREVISPGSNEQ